MSGALVFLASCSSEHYFEAPEQAPSGRPSMSIKISLGASSRADESAAPGFEVGEGLENYLDISNRNFRIYFFGKDDKFIDEFKPFIFPSSSSVTTVNGVQTVYYHEFRGEVPVDLPKKFKIVTLFNWPNYPQVKDAEGSEPFALVKGKTTISDLCRHSDSQFAALTGEGSWLDVDSKRLIPFFGVREYDLKKYLNDGDITSDDKIKDGVYIDLSTPKDGSTATPIPILRAMAKVEVILKNPFASFSDVQIDKFNPKGFCAPESATSHLDYDHNYNHDQDFIQSLHLPDGKNNPSETVSLSLTKVADTDISNLDEPVYEKWIAYIPEYSNKSDESYCSIIVTLNRPDYISVEDWSVLENDGRVSKTIYFSPNGRLDKDKALDIWRNNIYRFTITEMTTTLSCVLDVQPYADCVVDPLFGLDRDDSGNIIINRYPDGTVDVLDNGEKLRKDRDGDIILRYFKDGSVQCIEYIYKDYIHGTAEKDYSYTFEKDAPGGNMVVFRETTTGVIEDLENHDHDMNDRPLFVIDKNGKYWQVIYDSDGVASLSDTDIHGDLIIQANGYQFKDDESMHAFMGTYIVQLSDGSEELRDRNGDQIIWPATMYNLCLTRH